MLELEVAASIRIRGRRLGCIITWPPVGSYFVLILIICPSNHTTIIVYISDFSITW